MIVLRSTMDAAVEAERSRYRDLAERFGLALQRTNALAYQFAAWIFRDAEIFTPEAFAQMFYSRDDRFQAAFFNVMQAQVQARHDGMPEGRPGNTTYGPGVPAGESQWWYMAQHLDDSGFETLEVMLYHAKAKRAERANAARPEA